MKLILGIFISIVLSSFIPIDDIYNLSIQTIDGKKVDMRTLKGKKIMVVIIPISSSDTNVSLPDLVAIEKKYNDSLTVIGIPSQEAGYTKTQADSLKKLYKDHKSNFILADGMQVKKSEDGKQGTLFQWLTIKERNRHFNQDADGVGQKFFIDELGTLYAVIGSQIKLSNPVINRILSRPLPAPVGM